MNRLPSNLADQRSHIGLMATIAAIFIGVISLLGKQNQLTLSCLGGHLGGVLTLAIHNSPNNGPIDLSLIDLIQVRKLFYM
jgi:hypothetical protein